MRGSSIGEYEVSMFVKCKIIKKKNKFCKLNSLEKIMDWDLLLLNQAICLRIYS